MSITGVQTSGIASRIQKSPRHRVLFWWRILRSRFQRGAVIDTKNRAFRGKVIDTRKPKVLRLMNGRTLYYYEH